MPVVFTAFSITKMERNWFRSVFIVDLNISKVPVFAETSPNLRPVSPMYIFLHKVQVIQ